MRFQYLYKLFESSYLIRNTLQIDCSITNGVQASNATDNFTMGNPFHPKEGSYSKNISSNWTWQLDTLTTSRLADGNTSLLQSLSLTINPPPSPGLFSQDEFMGCGLIIHGAKYNRLTGGDIICRAIVRISSAMNVERLYFLRQVQDKI